MWAITARTSKLFSLPGETEIKKHISKLFSQTKSGKSNIQDEEDSNLENNNENDDNIDPTEWKGVLQNLTVQHTQAKPDFIYKEFLRIMKEDKNINNDELPSKQQIKSKIGYARTSLKKKLKWSIVWSYKTKFFYDKKIMECFGGKTD